jgi:hypothetical protein
MSTFTEQFELMRQVATGAGTAVYQARDRWTGKLVAVTVLQPNCVGTAASFEDKTTALAELDHPGIARWVGRGVTDRGEVYVAIEWLWGETLEESLARAPLSPNAVARLASTLLSALAVVHRTGIVHGSLRPSKIFLFHHRVDEPRILGFETRWTFPMGAGPSEREAAIKRCRYRAPEQIRGDRDVDSRADLFSLGCVLFECLTGEPPFTGESVMEVSAKIALGATPRIALRRPEMDPAMKRLVESMLAPERRHRPADAVELGRSFADLAGAGGDRDGTGGVMPLTPATLSDGEQRVMCGLLVSERAAEPTPVAPSGPPQATGRIRSLRGRGGGGIAAVVERFGGRTDRVREGALVVSMPAQFLLPEQAVQMASCALAIRSECPDAVMAIAVGRAVLLAGVPAGPLLDRLASRVEGPSGTISVDDLAARLLARRFHLEGTTERRLVAERDPADGANQPGPPAGLFSEREVSLVRVLQSYERAIESREARVSLVVAEPGMGKTRLAEELVSVLKAPAAAGKWPQPLVLSCAGHPFGGRARYPMLQGLLRSAGIKLDGESSREMIVEEWVAWLRRRCTDSPLLLLLDDLQWGDGASMRLVDAALQLVSDQPLFVLALARPEVDERFPGLWAGRAVERLPLRPIRRRTASAVLERHLDDGRLGAAPYILERFEGNPFFLQELISAVRGGERLVPDTVLGIVERRFDDLGPEVRRVLRAASMLGEGPFSPDALVKFLGATSRSHLADSLGILTERQILRRSGEGDRATFRFARRPLIREAALETLTTADRLLLPDAPRV